MKRFKPAESKALITDIKKRGYVLVNDCYYPPNSPEALQFQSQTINSKAKNKSRLKRIKTGWIDDTLNIKNKAGQIDQFISLCKQLYNIDVWPEFYFTTDKKYRFDYAIPIHNGINTRLAIEVEGGIWMRGRSAHSSGTGIARDMDKSTHAAQNGWRIIRVQPTQLLSTDTLDKIIKSLT